MQGDVLEVSAGTGRNLSYYNRQQVNSVTMTDTSKNMLWHARQKHDKHSTTLAVKFCLADAQRMVSDSSASQPNRERDDASASEQSQHASRLQDKLETFSPAQFDTVIDTFGLCSHENPKAALQVHAPPTGLQSVAPRCIPSGNLCCLTVSQSTHYTVAVRSSIVKMLTCTSNCSKWPQCASLVGSSSCCSMARHPGSG